MHPTLRIALAGLALLVMAAPAATASRPDWDPAHPYDPCDYDPCPPGDGGGLLDLDLDLEAEADVDVAVEAVVEADVEAEVDVAVDADVDAGSGDGCPEACPQPEPVRVGIFARICAWLGISL